MTGHGYVVYGPLLERVHYLGCRKAALNDPAATVAGELSHHTAKGVPYRAHLDRDFDEPGGQVAEGFGTSTPRLPGAVGEPLSPKIWMWYYQCIGNGRCPVVDTWWQAENRNDFLLLPAGCYTVATGFRDQAFSRRGCLCGGRRR